MAATPPVLDAGEVVARLAAGCSGRLGVAAVRLDTGEAVRWRSDERHRTASVVKLAVHVAVLAAVAAGEIRLHERLELAAGDRVGGSGVLNVLGPGIQPTVEDLCTLMVVVSDNTATNLLIDRVGGVEVVNDVVGGLGFDGITLHRRLEYSPPPLAAGPVEPRSPSGPLGTATPDGLCRLVTAIRDGEVVSPQVSARLLATLAHQQDRAAVPRAILDLPEPGQEEPGLPNVASKTGTIPGARTETGLLRLPGGPDIAYAVMADDLADTSMTALSEGDELLGRVGAALVAAWWPGPGPAPLRPGWPE